MNTTRLSLPQPATTDSMQVNPWNQLWTNLDPAIGPTICTTSTKPASPYACQWIHTTDDNNDQIWDPVASAWVTMPKTVLGIVGFNNTAASVAVTPINTKVMVGTVTSDGKLEQNRDYKVHAEGIYSYKIPANSATFTKPNGEQDSIYIHIHSGLTVTTLTSPTSQLYIGASGSSASSPPNVDTFIECTFAFDAIFNTGMLAQQQWTAGWSIQAEGAYLSNATAQTATHTLLYIERV